MSERTRRSTTAENTRRLPSRLVARITPSSRDGWISQARCTTASASSKKSIGSRVMSAANHVTFADQRSASVGAGIRRLTPSTDVTPAQASSARTNAVPTLPVAPRMTTRIDQPWSGWKTILTAPSCLSWNIR